LSSLDTGLRWLTNRPLVLQQGMTRIRFNSGRRGYRMKRFRAASAGWSAGVTALALLVAVGLAGSASAASLDKNLTATAQYSSSSDWQSDQGNTTFVAAKAFDGDLTTRWNSYSGDGEGSWLAATWSAPVTINKVVLREAFNRIDGFRVQQLQGSDWVD